MAPHCQFLFHSKPGADCLPLLAGEGVVVGEDKGCDTAGGGPESLHFKSHKGIGLQHPAFSILWEPSCSLGWDGWLDTYVKSLGAAGLALPRGLGLTALMNIEYLDEADTDLPLGSHWKEGS